MKIKKYAQLKNINNIKLLGIDLVNIDLGYNCKRTFCTCGYVGTGFEKKCPICGTTKLKEINDSSSYSMAYCISDCKVKFDKNDLILGKYFIVFNKDHLTNTISADKEFLSLELWNENGIKHIPNYPNYMTFTKINKDEQINVFKYFMNNYNRYTTQDKWRNFYKTITPFYKKMENNMYLDYIGLWEYVNNKDKYIPFIEDLKKATPNYIDFLFYFFQINSKIKTSSYSKPSFGFYNVNSLKDFFDTLSITNIEYKKLALTHPKLFFDTLKNNVYNSSYSNTVNNLKLFDQNLTPLFIHYLKTGIIDTRTFNLLFNSFQDVRPLSKIPDNILIKYSIKYLISQGPKMFRIMLEILQYLETNDYSIDEYTFDYKFFCSLKHRENIIEGNKKNSEDIDNFINEIDIDFITALHNLSLKKHKCTKK